MENNTDVQYWTEFYKKFNESMPSTFAQFVLPYTHSRSKIVELGCGNCRDLKFFASTGHTIYGIDKSCKPEIGERYVVSVGDFTSMPDMLGIDMIYSRFTIHSVDEPGEDKTIEWAINNLSEDGLFCVEARTINDSIYGIGTKVAEHSFINTHFRRFIEPQKFINKLLPYFKIIYFIESKDLSPYGNENPTLMRIIAKKHVQTRSE